MPTLIHINARLQAARKLIDARFQLHALTAAEIAILKTP